MKRVLSTIIVLIVTIQLYGQTIDVNNFDEKLFEKILFHEMIEFRKSIGKDSLVWSDVLYSNISKSNTQKMIDENKLFHPDQSDIWTIDLKNKLGDELVDKQKVKIFKSQFSGPMFSTSEIAAKIPVSLVTTYQELAARVIKGWDGSEYHREIQRMKMTNDGALAMASCSVKLSKDKKNFFIEFDFSIPYCIE
jgi:hypothetical protein